SKRAFEYAVPMAKAFDAEIYFIHVIPLIPHAEPNINYHFDVPEYELILENDAKKRLSESARSVGADVATHEILAHGDAATGILKAVDESKIDLIVIATAGHSGWQHLVFGGVTEKVVRQARCPVLSVRAPNPS
ncbi:MAG: universal stress protein, partial [Vicinamibacteria bacterium]